MSKKLYGSLAVAAAMLMGSQQAALAANLVVAQQDVAVGTNVTVAGVKYQIMQFEVPAFDSDKIYLIKFPVEGNPASTTDYFSAFVSVYGSPTGQDPFDLNTINGSSCLNGFKTYFHENFNYNANYNRISSQSNLNNSLTLSSNVGIVLDGKTYVSLSIASKSTNQNLTSPTHTADTSTKLHATPTALTKSQRNKFIVDSRALYKYISIKEKL